MNVLIVLNDPPYGTERSYNGVRLAGSLARRDDTTVRLFLIGDAVSCAKAGQQVPAGFYNLERMLGSAARHGAEIGCCGTCMEARGLTDTDLTGCARRSTLDELTDWVGWADKVITF